MTQVSEQAAQSAAPVSVRAVRGHWASVTSKPTTVPPLVDVLAPWQSEARTLLDQLRCKPHPEGVLPSSEVQQRTAAMRRLRWTMIPRETRKQRFLWPSIRQHLDDGADVVGDLRQLKQEFEQAMIRLRWADERSQRFDRQIDTLIDRVRGYLDCETRLLPRLGTAIPLAEQERVTRRLTQPGGVLPVQPHPDLPSAPWAAALLGPIAAVVDRFRDRFTTAPG